MLSTILENVTASRSGIITNILLAFIPRLSCESNAVMASPAVAGSPASE